MSATDSTWAAFNAQNRAWWRRLRNPHGCGLLEGCLPAVAGQVQALERDHAVVVGALIAKDGRCGSLEQQVENQKAALRGVYMNHEVKHKATLLDRIMLDQETS